MNHIKQNQVRFSDYVETYQKEVRSSIGFIGQDIDFFIRLKSERLIDITRKYLNDPHNIKVLDVGSGIGLMDSMLVDKFRNLSGVDIEQDIIDKAAERNPGVNYMLYDGYSLPCPDNSMNLVFAVNVLHHVPPADWNNFVREMFRVTGTGGMTMIFEHNPYNPFTRIAVSRCEFDRDAVLIRKKRLIELMSSSGFRIAEHSYMIFFPFKGKLFRNTENFIGWLPLGAQYYIAGLKK
jgi:SAM-dependent methyltransferase